MATFEDIKPDDRGDHSKDHWRRPDPELDEVDAIMSNPSELFDKPRYNVFFNVKTFLLYEKEERKNS